jgi:site-specific DNA-cytosine methylase
MGKAPTLLARADTPKILVGERIRKLTPLECERLQCLPDNFTEGFSRTPRYKMIGNGFTVSVIEHLLKNQNVKKQRTQLKLAI